MNANIKKLSCRFMLLRELKKIKRSRSLFIVAIVYPIFILFILSILFQQEIITRLPITVVDLDQSVTSRQIIQTLSAVPEVLISERSANLIDAKMLLLKNDIYGIVFIPPNFEQHILASLKPEISIFYNNQFMTAGNTLNKALYSGISATISNIQMVKITSNGIPAPLAKQSLSPIAIDLHALFNPTLNFAFILVNGIYPSILQIIMMLTMTSAMHIERQKQSNFTFLWQMARDNAWLFFINQCLLYLILFSGSLLFLDFILFSYYGMPMRGNVFLLIAGSLSFVSASLAFSLLLSLVITDKVRNFGSVSIITSSAFGFTGLIFPRASMNTFAYLWGGMLPVTWYIKLKLDQTLRGIETLDALKPLLFLNILTIIPIVVIGYLHKRREKKYA